MANIHPSSVIENGARIDPGVEIGPFCHVGPKAAIGAGTRLVSHVSVIGRTTIGAGNTVWPGAVLGADPQDLKFHGEDAELVIGDNNDIRECATLHIGTGNGGGFTRVGNDNLVMAYAHVGHDCVLGSHIILANAVQLAGHIHVHDHANIGGATALHHYVTVGQYAFVGGMTRVVHDVPPFMLVEGNPAKVRSVNTIGLKRHHFDQVSIDRLKTAFRKLYRGDGESESETGNIAEHLQWLEAQFPGDECIAILVGFTRRSMVGTFGRHRESQRVDDRYRNPVR